MAGVAKLFGDVCAKTFPLMQLALKMVRFAASAMLAAALVGCVAPENDPKPWTQPAGWEHGMPDVPHRQ